MFSDAMLHNNVSRLDAAIYRTMSALLIRGHAHLRTTAG